MDVVAAPAAVIVAWQQAWVLLLHLLLSTCFESGLLWQHLLLSSCLGSREGCYCCTCCIKLKTGPTTRVQRSASSTLSVVGQNQLVANSILECNLSLSWMGPTT